MKTYLMTRDGRTTAFRVFDSVADAASCIDRLPDYLWCCIIEGGPAALMARANTLPLAPGGAAGSEERALRAFAQRQAESLGLPVPDFWQGDGR
ncbi:MAG: hypothetical protein ACREER_05545 [Alphaproteobacteria bacterium]